MPKMMFKRGESTIEITESNNVICHAGLDRSVYVVFQSPRNIMYNICSFRLLKQNNECS